MRTLAMPLVCAGLGACAPPAATMPVAASTPTPAISPACDVPELHQLDFWLGDWDVVVHARKAPDSDEWADAPGRQHVEKVLSGCAVSETFSASGPGPAWAGRSYSSWQPKLGKWRQTWVDDQGSYLAFVGGVEAGTMTLYGEPQVQPDGGTAVMRMVWLDVTPQALRWEWQRSVDAGKTWTPMMTIDYRRRSG